MKETTRRKFIKQSTLLLTALGIGFTFGPAVSSCYAASEPAPKGSSSTPGIYQLFSPNNEAPVIVVGLSASESERYAAQELSEHLAKIIGKAVPVAQENEIPDGKKTIAIGKSKLTDGYDISSLGVEQYIIDVKPDGVVIVGGEQEPVKDTSGELHARNRGTLYGVYEFLENLGVRWYRPEPWGWHIPKSDTIGLKIGRKVSAPPAFIGRQPVWDYFARWGSTPEQVLENRQLTEIWVARQRANIQRSAPPTLDENKYGGRVYAQLGHAHNKIIPPAQYLTTHPEYFALVEGKRGYRPGNYAGGPQLCLGNPEVQELFAAKVVERAKANPQMYCISVDPEDGTDLKNRMCKCELCMAMDDPKNPENMSNRVFGFTNIIARKAAEEAPGAKVGLYAYSAHTAAPTIIDKLEPNIVVGLANINSWSDWRKKLQDPTGPQNTKFLQLVKDWNKVAPHKLWMREYGAYGWHGPVPMERLLQDRMRNYRDLGFEGMIYPHPHRRGPQLLTLYLTAQLLWNPDLDLEKELDLFYENYYGQAAGPMKKYHERWMEVFEDSKVGIGNGGPLSISGGRGMHILCSPALMKELGEYISEAQKLVQGKPLYERRFKGTWAGYEFSRRVSEILSLKAQYGQVQPHPRLKTKKILVTPKAQQAWAELRQWAEEVNKEDLTFSVADLDQKIGESVYMGGDVLENRRYGPWNEPALLKANGFGEPQAN